MTSNDPSQRTPSQPGEDNQTGDTSKQQVTHNLDTGEDEPLTPPGTEDESAMDFASGSGGGSAGDGGAA